MKNKKLSSYLIAAAFSWCLGFGGIACMVTGLRLDAHLGVLGVLCALVALALVVGFRFCRGRAVCIAVCALAALMAMSPDFLSQSQSMLHAIVQYYHRAYGLVIPAWLQEVRDHSHTMPLLLIAAVVMTVTAWTVLRRKSAIPAVAAALLPLASCLVVTDTVPSNSAIFLLLFALVLLIMTSAARRKNGGGVRLTAVLSLPVAAALLLLLTLVPRDGFQGPVHTGTLDGLLNWFTAGLPSVEHTFEGEPVFSFGSTAKQNINLAMMGKNEMGKAPVMEIVSETDGKIYLRGRSYDIYNGTSWQAVQESEDLIGISETWLGPAKYTTSVKMLRKRGQYYLPCYLSDSVALEGGMLPNPSYEKEYTFIRRELLRNWEEYYFYGWVNETPSHTQLPEKTRQRAEEYLKRFLNYSIPVNPGHNHYLEAVHRIGNHVRLSARYDLNTERMGASEQDFAMWFLEQSETGYCVHFATAATVLLRAAGIPARYVEGYTVYADAWETTIVRENHAHAWVEYYVPAVGWVILDPTPAAEEVPVGTEEPVNTTAPSTEPSEETTTAPSDTVTQPSTEAGSEGTSGSGATTPSGGGGEPQKELPRWIGTALLWIGACALFCAAVVGQWMLRLRLKQNWLQKGSANVRGLKRWREALRMAKLRGVDAPEELRVLAEKARFSQHMLTKAELEQFNAFLRDSRNELRQRPWYLGFVYRFIYALY